MKQKTTKETALELLEFLCRTVPVGIRVQKGPAANFIVLSELADVLAEEFGAERITLDAALDLDYGVICVDTDEVIFERGCSHSFFKYIKHADFLTFSDTADGLLRVAFGVKNLVAKENIDFGGVTDERGECDV